MFCPLTSILAISAVLDLKCLRISRNKLRTLEVKDKRLKRLPLCLYSGVNGLYNYGNQCFINAVLQSLSSLKSMNSWLNYANSLHNERHNSLTNSLLNTINGKNNTLSEEPSL